MCLRRVTEGGSGSSEEAESKEAFMVEVACRLKLERRLWSHGKEGKQYLPRYKKTAGESGAWMKLE